MIGGFDMKLTQKLAKQYHKADKKTKGEILSEYCRLTEVSRNNASKRFCKQAKNIYPRVLPTGVGNRRGRRKKFNSTHVSIVKECWELSGGYARRESIPCLRSTLTNWRQLDFWRLTLKITYP